MDHYLTTYNKDYLWPSSGAAGAAGGGGGAGGGGPGGGAEFKASPQELAFLQACIRHSRPADCRCPGNTSSSPAAPGGAGGGADQDWSRTQVMGPLLDPKLFPARVGASPEVASSRYDQPNAFLDKLESKFPMLYSILQNAPNAELKQRIERDRNKTTYQVDYCEAGPGAAFANLQRAADTSGTATCSTPLRLPGDPCRVQAVQAKAHAPRASGFTKNNPSGGGGGQTCDTTSAATPPLGRTEYQDGVSKLGAIIMRDKLHRKH